MPRTEPYGTRSTVRAIAAKQDTESNTATVDGKSKLATEHDTIMCPLPTSQSEARPDKGASSNRPPEKTSDQSGIGNLASSPSSSPAAGPVYKLAHGASDLSQVAGSKE